MQSFVSLGRPRWCNFGCCKKGHHKENAQSLPVRLLPGNEGKMLDPKALARACRAGSRQLSPSNDGSKSVLVRQQQAPRYRQSLRWLLLHSPQAFKARCGSPVSVGTTQGRRRREGRRSTISLRFIRSSPQPADWQRPAHWSLLQDCQILKG